MYHNLITQCYKHTLTLSLFFQNNNRPVVVLIRYMLDVAVGMHYIAEKGLVHRVRYSVT